MTTTAPPLLVTDIRIGYTHGAHRARKAVDVVHGVSFEVQRGQTLSLVGQSGSGKSTIAHAVGGLLPLNGRITGGSIRVHGTDVTAFRRRQWRPLRGNTIGFVPQDPLSSLDPLRRVGDQIAQALTTHNIVAAADVRGRVVSLLDRVGIRNPADRARSYPHELSGGQLQRVLIAIAIAAEPTILIADEPTSALDVTIQKTILDLLGTLQLDLGLAILFITHDLALAHDRSDSVAVLNHGVLREHGSVADVLGNPQDPYTIKLLSDAPALSVHKYAARAHQPLRSARALIRVDSLTKVYAASHSAEKSAAAPPALDRVSLDVLDGSIHALVGESGSGKTTLARIVAGLTGFTAGSLSIGDRDLPFEPPLVNRHARELQLVYQNPLAAVDPRYSVERIIEEPLIINRVGDRASRKRLVAEMLDKVALSRTVLTRKPREVSGGQRQRIAVARALVLAPRVLVLDEPTSALDVTVQAQIIDLLLDLQERSELTYLFISHDLSLVRQIANQVTVLEQGRVVESGTVGEIFDAPRHPYTIRLLESIPGAGVLQPAVT